MNQLIIGLLLGLLIGMSLRQLRPLVMLVLSVTLIGVGYLFYEQGAPGVVRLFDQLAAQARLYSAFFASLAIGKLIGGVLIARR